jgi:sugar phosphate isomerase/epimerase
MRLSVSNYSFEVLPLEATLMICQALGFKGVDIAGFHARGNCSFEPEAIAANPQAQAAILLPLLEKYGLTVVDFFPQFGVAPSLHSLNDPDPAICERDLYLVRGAAQFCKLIGCPGMTLLPGVDHLERPHAENLRVSGQNLQQAVQIAGEYGVEVRFEPHMGSVADTPELAIQLLEMAPGLKATLDIAHFVLQYIPIERIYKLIPYTGHVHVRPARPGKLQTAYEEGTIDFVELIGRLKAVNYGGALSIEYVCADWFGVNRNDTLYETAVTKAALEPYVGV